MSLTRSDAILKYIVEYFIKNAQPVGSHTLIEEYHLPYSSATIRNEMFALEKMGYIEKTHSSSGRVPSSKGYKYYCKYLREKNIDESLKNSLQVVLEQKMKSIEEVIQESCEILSHMTNLVSVVTGSNESIERLANIQLIQISDNAITAVFVTDKGYVENKTFRIDENTKLSDVESCVKLLNDRLKGTPISELVPKMEAIRPLINDYVINHDVIYQAMLEAFVGFAKDRLSAFGQEELFDQPEFANDALKMKKLLELLNTPEIFREVEDEEDGDISIHIGGESNDDDDVSIVQARIKMPGKQERSIAVVGPKRMDYDKVVSSLEYLINQLDEYYDLGNGKEVNREREERKPSEGNSKQKQR